MSSAPQAHSKKLRCFFGAPALAAIILLATSGQTQANILGPYLPDVDTLHLWHMNEQVVPVIDVGPDGVHLSALRNGATLGNVSFRGFGTALSTYDAGPDATTDIGRDAYLAGRPLVNGLSDNIPLAYMGVSKAFTFEALVRIDFDPLTNYSTNSPGNGRGTCMQILSLDADENTNRVCQLLVVPIGVEGNSQPLLEFANLDRDRSPQILTAAIPTTGPDAIALNSRYHLAVTYDGSPGAPDNLRFYWTLLDPARSATSLIGTGRMLNDLPLGCAPDFAIGQTGRQSPGAPYPNNNFVGLIDEVRISASARAPSQMMFGSREIAAAGAVVGGSQPQSSENASSSNGPNNTIHSKAIVPRVQPSSYIEYLERGNVPILIALGLIACLLLWLGIVLKRAIPQRKPTRSGLTYAIEERDPSQGQPAPERPSNPARNPQRDPGYHASQASAKSS